jgi:hypothetical protein
VLELPLLDLKTARELMQPDQSAAVRMQAAIRVMEWARFMQLSRAVTTLVDLMRTGAEPARSDAAIELSRMQEAVRRVLPAEADAIIAEAVDLAIPAIKAKLARLHESRIETDSTLPPAARQRGQ